MVDVPLPQERNMDMKIQTEYGYIDVSGDVIAGIVSVCANNCFGVCGMAHRSKTDGIVNLLKGDSYRKGVAIDMQDDHVDIDLHIIVKHGINIAAAGESIINEIRYNVELLTGIKVGTVDIFVDSIMID